MHILQHDLDMVTQLAEACERLGTTQHAQKVISEAAGSIFKEFGMAFANAMKGKFTSFTGEVKEGIKVKSFSGNIVTESSGVTLLEVGIAEGTVSRDHGFHQDQGRRPGKGVPIDDPNFKAWIMAKFSPKTPAEYRRAAIYVSGLIKKRGQAPKFALSKAVATTLGEYDAIVNRFGDVLVQRIFNEFDTGTY